MRRPARVLFLYPSTFYGPVMTVFGDIVRHLDPDEVEAHVAVNADATGELPLGPGEARISEWRFGGSPARGAAGERARALARLGPAVAGVAAYARRQRIDVVQTTPTPYAGSLGLLVTSAARAALLAHVHQVVGRHPGTDRPYAAARRIPTMAVVRRAAACVAVSEFIRAQLIAQGVPADRTHVVANGVDLERFSGVDGTPMRREYAVGDEEVLVLQLGRITDGKRQEDTIRALALARREAPRLRGVIVGWEDPRESGLPGSRSHLERVIAEHEVTDAVTLAPARPEAPELVAAADVVVAPSEFESFGLVVIEAMAAGKPVVGARSGAIPELIADGDDGFLVEPRNPEQLARRLVELAGDAELRQRVGAAARRRAETSFDQRRLAAEFTPIYRTLADLGTSSPR